MPHFFITRGDVDGRIVTLTGGDAAHLRGPLRVARGEQVVFVEDGAVEHRAEVFEISQRAVRARILWSRVAGGEPRARVHVLQAVPAQGMDLAVESLALAGAASIRPVLTARAVARPDAARGAARSDRWRRIAREAAQLCGRAVAPEVFEPQSLRTALHALPPGSAILAAVPAAAQPLAQLVARRSGEFGLLIGPEGGLTSEELDELRGVGATLVHLGSRVIPSRLAGSLAVTLLLARAGDLDAAAAPPP